MALLSSLPAGGLPDQFCQIFSPQPVIDIGGALDISKTTALLTSVVADLRSISDQIRSVLKEDLHAAETDARVVEELFEENVYDLLRANDRFQDIVESLMDEIEAR